MPKVEGKCYICRENALTSGGISELGEGELLECDCSVCGRYYLSQDAYDAISMGYMPLIVLREYMKNAKNMKKPIKIVSEYDKKKHSENDVSLPDILADILASMKK